MSKNINKIRDTTTFKDTEKLRERRATYLPYNYGYILSNTFRSIALDEGTAKVEFLRHSTRINPMRGPQKIRNYHDYLIEEYNVISGEERNNVMALNLYGFNCGYMSVFNKTWFCSMFTHTATNFAMGHPDVKIELNDAIKSVVLYNITMEEIYELVRIVTCQVADSVIDQFKKNNELSDNRKKMPFVYNAQFRSVCEYVKKSLHVQTMGKDDYAKCRDMYKEFKKNNITESISEAFSDFCYNNDGNIGCAKVIIRGVDNYDLRNKSEVEKCQKHMKKIYERLENKNVPNLHYKVSRGHQKCGLEVYTNDLSQINIVKLFGIKKYSVMIPDGLDFLSVDEMHAFENILQ